MSGKLQTRATVHFLEPSHAGIEGGGTALRETHHGDPRGVDPGVFGNYFERAESIHNPRQPKRRDLA